MCLRVCVSVNVTEVLGLGQCLVSQTSLLSPGARDPVPGPGPGTQFRTDLRYQTAVPLVHALSITSTEARYTSHTITHVNKSENYKS